ncbi:hypothetical protein YPPY94_4587 [Yersinia pestis PY-94]|nr:hypothetical protein YPPY02_4534 [Yersinia pestis PY-02]EIQ83410.1 hypothetical protein YPPY01_4477 [Yersinia pestis PY-01]EIQ97947.1 hypothetical protein YPPY05_4519 [Yersinia pestis PY-05]EIR01041.1 hypothetical protein YPPY06_4579 [Yersinia pestis PY-06]EIR12137.1 hypothetical protein YPPY07_4444 [Yersinia pestis PY-07]EIR13723.1 hypothetical protein YPPY09_4587 [Yersinia pestis PY-09]EIR26419.1 hypothetical protein YPPY10_4591 [Yersinia pestis PY-10]EIR27053.1 hypothetical protein YPP
MTTIRITPSHQVITGERLSDITSAIGNRDLPMLIKPC